MPDVFFSELRRNVGASRTLADTHRTLSVRIQHENSKLVHQSETAIFDAKKLLRSIDRILASDRGSKENAHS